MKKGDIVINGAQTEQLLKYGKLSTFAGNAYASGTVGTTIPLMNSFGTGSSLGIGSGSLSGSSGSTTINNNNTVINNYGNSGSGSNGSKGQGSEAKSTLDSFKEWTGNFFDWIEIRIDYITKRAENYYNKAQQFIEKGLANLDGTLGNEKNYIKARDNLKEATFDYVRLIQINEDGAARYQEQANRVLSKGKKSLNSGDKKTLDSAVKTLNAGGKIDISEYNENVRSVLDEYQNWYDKATECRYALTDLNSTLADYREELYNLPLTQAAEKIEKLSAAMDVLNSKTDVATMGESTIATYAKIMGESAEQTEKSLRKMESRQKSAQKSYEKSIDKEASAKKDLKNAGNKLKKNKSLSKSQRQQIADGEKVSTNGLSGKALSQAKAYNKKVDTLNKATTAKKDAKAQRDAANTAATTAKKRMELNKKQAQEAQKYQKKDNYEYANYLAKLSLENSEDQYKANAEALKKTEETVAYRQKVSEQTKAKLSTTKRNLKSSDTKGRKKNEDGTYVLTGLKGAALERVKAYNKAVRESIAASGKYDQALIAMDEAQEIATTSAAELAQAHTEYAKTTFENIQNYYDGQLKYEQLLNEADEKSIELAKAKGQYDNTSNYDKRIANMKEERKIVANEAADLEKQLAEHVKNGYIKKGSDEWIEMQSEILNAKNQVKDFDVQIANTEVEKLEVKYATLFDRAIERIDQFKDKIGELNSLINDEMKFDYDTGDLTQAGMLSILFDVKDLNSSQENLGIAIKKRQEILNDYQKEFGKAYVQGENEIYDNWMKEVDGNIQSQLSATKSAQEKLISMMETLADKEREAMVKVIDARKEALSAKKEYADYDKNLRQQNEEIISLERQKAALEGLTDAESKAKKAQLEAQLKEKRENLDETIQDHVYELKLDGLDELEEQLNENYEKYVYELSGNLELMTEAINKLINASNENVAESYSQLIKILRSVGLSDAQIQQSGLTNISGYASGTKNASKGMHVINENGVESIYSPSTGKIYRYFDGGEKVATAKQTELFNRIVNGSIPTSIFDWPKLAAPNIDNATSPNVSVHYDSLLNVQGDVSKNTLPELKEILERSYQYTVRTIQRESSKNGLK